MKIFNDDYLTSEALKAKKGDPLDKYTHHCLSLLLLFALRSQRAQKSVYSSNLHVKTLLPNYYQAV
jgi:hypothetical protein